MKYSLLLPLLLFFTCCKAQESGILVQQNLVSDLSGTPVYERLTREENGQITWKEEFQYLDSIDIFRITYLSDGLKINGLLVKPKGDGNYPCVIYNRGGNREFGSLKLAHGAITLGKVAKEGYVVIASQYRGNGGSEGMEEFGGNDVNDVTILPKVLAEISGADTSKIGMYGWSRGGMMTYLALTKMDQLKAVVVGGALSDMESNMAERPEMEKDVMAELIPDFYANKTHEMEKRSAIHWADKFPKNVPLLILHGNADWRVKPEQSLKLTLELEKYRVPYGLMIFEGGDHGISEHDDEKMEQIIRWFDRFLKNGEPLPDMEYHGK